jgi:hypothetical protein
MDDNDTQQPDEDETVGSPVPDPEADQGDAEDVPEAD